MELQFGGQINGKFQTVLLKGNGLSALIGGRCNIGKPDNCCSLNVFVKGG